MTDDSTYLADVRAQYEDYPYPARDPADEKNRLICTWSDFLARINHYCFQGRQSFDNGFRALVAGGGTGDAAIFLGEQLKARDAEVMYLDISKRSMDVARQRAQVRGLENIRWVHGSLLDAAKLDLGAFDYINCSGVLHHLESPERGLEALLAVLKTDGALGLMLYGKYGRAGVYQMQSLLRQINQDEPDIEQRIANTKTLLDNLPETNWYRHGVSWFEDIDKYGDVGIYDLLLHSQDRAYSVPELYQWLENDAGLHIQLSQQNIGAFGYEPSRYINDPGVLERIQALPLSKRQAIAELLAGNITKHNLYVTRTANAAASIDDLDNVPFLFLHFDWLKPPALADVMERHPGQTVNFDVPGIGMKMQLPTGQYTHAIFRYLDGNNSLKEIFDIVRSKKPYRKQPPPDQVLLEDFRPTFDSLNRLDGMLLGNKP